MLDSGSTFSVEKFKFCSKQTQILLIIFEAEEPQAVPMANGQKIVLKHCVELNITISGLVMPFKFYVTDSLSEQFNVIIGLDFMEMYNGKIDFSEGFVCLDNELVLAKLFQKPNRMQVLHPIEDTELCSVSEATFFLAAPSKFNQKQIYSLFSHRNHLAI